MGKYETSTSTLIRYHKGRTLCSLHCSFLHSVIGIVTNACRTSQRTQRSIEAAACNHDRSRCTDHGCKISGTRRTVQGKADIGEIGNGWKFLPPLYRRTDRTQERRTRAAELEVAFQSCSGLPGTRYFFDQVLFRLPFSTPDTSTAQVLTSSLTTTSAPQAIFRSSSFHLASVPVPVSQISHQSGCTQRSQSRPGTIRNTVTSFDNRGCASRLSGAAAISCEYLYRPAPTTIRHSPFAIQVYRSPFHLSISRSSQLSRQLTAHSSQLTFSVN